MFISFFLLFYAVIFIMFCNNICYNVIVLRDIIFSRSLSNNIDCEANSYNLFNSLSSPLPGTRTNHYWWHMRNHGHDPCGVRTHNPEVAWHTLTI